MTPPPAIASAPPDLGLDLGALRGRFPALAREHRGRAVAYFDGPGGTQVFGNVAAAMADYLLHHNANTHWAFPTSRETDAALANAREGLADFLNADPGEVAFGANMTTLTFHLARALGRRLGPGDEIVVTELDHHANVDPWRAIERERGVTVRAVPFDPETGELDGRAFAEYVGPRTRLVAVGGASNAFGTVNDLAHARALADAVGALLFVDAVHLAPHHVIDVKAIGCDFLACSAYKFYGPHVGVLYGKREHLAALDVPKLRPAPDTAPERLETGTQNHEGIVGAAAAVDAIAAIGAGASRRERVVDALARIAAHERHLFARLWEGLRAIPGVQVFGPPPSPRRCPTVAFGVRGVAPRAICEALAEQALFLSHGDFYATTAVSRVGHAADGLVRAGLSLYSTASEVDRLLAAVADAAREAPRP
jgi:cysteine desulfurase family protein (TIGR01976 family)